MKIKFSLTILFIITFSNMYSQNSKTQMQGVYEEDEYIEVIYDTIHDTIFISNLDDVTRMFGLSYDEYVRQFMKLKEQKDSSNRLSVDRIYLNYFLPLLNFEDEFIKKRFITREYNIKDYDSSVKITQKNYPFSFSMDKTGIYTDCMITFYGTKETDKFLNSPTQIKSCIGQLFTSIYAAKGKINGLNFYFPDFTFKEKRAIAQFIKSVSIVIDSLKALKKIKGIEDIGFFVSFNEDQIKNRDNKDFAYGLTLMVDNIFIFKDRASDNSLPKMDVIAKDSIKDISFLNKVKNQFYLARFNIDDFPKVNSDDFLMDDIYKLMDADYPDNNWEVYMFVIIGIFVLIIAIIIFYLFNPMISYYINKNIDYIYSLIVMIFLEILVLIANLFESMSRDDVFTLGSGNRFIILLLPLMFIFILPMMKVIGKKRQVP